MASGAGGCKEGSSLQGERSLKRVCGLLAFRLWISDVQNPRAVVGTH